MNLFGGFGGGCGNTCNGGCGCDCCTLIILIWLLQSCGCNHGTDNMNLGGCDCCTILLLLILLGCCGGCGCK